MHAAEKPIDGSAVVARIQAAYGVPTLAALAQLLDESPSTVGSWVRRNSVPLPVLMACAQSCHVSIEHLLWGEAGAQIASSAPGSLSKQVKKSAHPRISQPPSAPAPAGRYPQGPVGEQLMARDRGPPGVEPVLLNERERCLIENYREAAESGKRALDQTSAALAESKDVKRSA